MDLSSAARPPAKKGGVPEKALDKDKKKMKKTKEKPLSSWAESFIEAMQAIAAHTTLPYPIPHHPHHLHHPPYPTPHQHHTTPHHTIPSHPFPSLPFPALPLPEHPIPSFLFPLLRALAVVVRST